MSTLVDSSTFSLRLNRFYNFWNGEYNKPESPWYSVDLMVITSGELLEDSPTPKSMQFHLWLWGTIIQNSIIVCMRTKEFFFLGDNSENNSSKSSNSDNINKIADQLKKYTSSNQKKIYKIGIIQGKHESITGANVKDLHDQCLKSFNFVTTETVNIRDGFAVLLCVHDSIILNKVKKACIFAIKTFQSVLVHRIEDILDNELNVSHKSIVETVENIFDDKALLKQWDEKYKLSGDSLNVVYCNVQSGSSCNLTPAALPSDDPLNLSSGTIIISLGVTYDDYAANIVRTILFNTSKFTQTSYVAACDVLDYAISLMAPETMLSDIYNRIKMYVEKKHKALYPYLKNNFGHALSLEFCETCLMINDKSKRLLKEGMVFNVSIGFTNVPLPDVDQKDNHCFSIWLADTVQITSKGQPPKILTQACDRKLKSVNYEISEEEEEESEEEKKKEKTSQVISQKNDTSKKPDNPKQIKLLEKEMESNMKSNMPSIDIDTNETNLRSKSNPASRRACAVSVENMRKLLEEQKILRINKINEMRERFREGHVATSLLMKEKHEKSLSSFIAYKDAILENKNLQPNRICFDSNHNALLIPITDFGMVPFHIAMIKNITCQLETHKYYTIRVQFHIPKVIGTSKQNLSMFPNNLPPNAMYIKEITLKSSNSNIELFLCIDDKSDSIPEMCKAIKESQKILKESIENDVPANKVSSSTQLEINRHRNPNSILKGVILKCASNYRRSFGIMEAHLNGLRYSGQRSEPVDILYSNIKFFFFQPCESDVVVLLHFHLKEPIMINKKKVMDVQIYSEAASSVEDLDSRRKFRNIYDPDEIDAEEKEKENINRRNLEFQKFAKEVEQFAKRNNVDLEYEQPLKDLSFYGVTKNYNQLLSPTKKNLVQLTEWPIFIMNLDDIEIVSFERLYHGLRQFDMVFIFKNYNKPVTNITSIPISYLENIKKWLNASNIVWYESKGNLNWNGILKIISEDVIGFLDDGGFEIFLRDETSKYNKKKIVPSNGKDENANPNDDVDDNDDDSETYTESEEDYVEDEDDYTESEEEDDSDYVTEDDEHEESQSFEESDDGVSWDELERQAIIDDRKKNKNIVTTTNSKFSYNKRK